MGTIGIVLFLPRCSDVPYLIQSGEQVGIQHIFPVGSVKALNVGILSRRRFQAG